MATTRDGAQRWVPERPTVTRLRSSAHECRGCELWADATQVVFSAGPRDARLMLVGEQPGDIEDREGEPFVGPAGRILDTALKDAGIDRADVYLTKPWLEAELEVIRPEVVICLGSVAGRAVMGRPVTISDERGRWLDGGEKAMRGAEVIVLTAHPASVLRLRQLDDAAPARQAMEDLVADLSFAAHPREGIPSASRR